DTAVVASATSHINAVMASSLAGAFDAPILPTKPDRLPDAVGAVLREVKPSRIFYIDCGVHAPEPLLDLKQLPWCPEIIEFSNIEDDPFDLSIDIHRYGLSQGIWGDTIMLVDFNDNSESIAAAPLACSMNCPILVTLGEPRLDEIARAASEGRYDHAIVVGPSVSASVDSHLEQSGLEVDRIALESSQKTAIALCRKTIRHLNDKHHSVHELCAASLSLSQWPELLGSGAYAGKCKAALLLENPTDLDDIAQCLDFIAEEGSAIKRITFIGKESGLSRLDRELLLEALKDSDSAQSA
ncbi:MAG: cell wall-binding repeat-containing protein, partial [Raoultibacter sp.]